jgi:hypothetical protein
MSKTSEAPPALPRANHFPLQQLLPLRPTPKLIGHFVRWGDDFWQSRDEGWAILIFVCLEDPSVRAKVLKHKKTDSLAVVLSAKLIVHIHRRS